MTVLHKALHKIHQGDRTTEAVEKLKRRSDVDVRWPVGH